MNTLAGITIVRNAVQFDYNIIETVHSLLACCDHVFIGECGSSDTTMDELHSHFGGDSRVHLIDTSAEWNNTEGKYRLSACTNKVADAARFHQFDYQLYVQADEIVHESSYPAIWEAMEQGENGYMCRRINLWGSPYRILNVPLNRQPCSVEVIRLTRAGMQAYDDAENIACDAVNMDFIPRIQIYHMGFVRRRAVMKAKVINMQRNVFGMDHDQKLDQEELFNPWLWFDKTDTAIINQPLPVLIRDWAKERAVDYEVNE